MQTCSRRIAVPRDIFIIRIMKLRENGETKVNTENTAPTPKTWSILDQARGQRILSVVLRETGRNSSAEKLAKRAHRRK